jgi:hypothetical protein
MQEVTATTFAKAAKLAGTFARGAKSRHAATFGNPIQGAGLISVKRGMQSNTCLSCELPTRHHRSRQRGMQPLDQVKGPNYDQKSVSIPPEP